MKNHVSGLKSGSKFSLTALFFTITLAFSLAGCNTIEGIGKDIERAGDSIQDAAD